MGEVLRNRKNQFLDDLHPDTPGHLGKSASGAILCIVYSERSVKLMCIFCAAVPMSAAAGAVIAGKQAQLREQALESGKELSVKAIPVGKITAVVTGGLLVCSATYHLIVVPHLGGIV